MLLDHSAKEQRVELISPTLEDRRERRFSELGSRNRGSQRHSPNVKVRKISREPSRSRESSKSRESSRSRKLTVKEKIPLWLASGAKTPDRRGSDPSPIPTPDLFLDQTSALFLAEINAIDMLPKSRARRKAAILISLAAVLLLHNLCFSYIGALFVDSQLITSTKISKDSLTYIFISFLLSMLLFSPPCTFLISSHISIRSAIIYSTIFQALLMGVFCNITLFGKYTSSMAILIRVFQGLCASFCQSGAFSAVEKIFTKNSGKIIAVSTVWIGVGLLMGPIIGLWLFRIYFILPSLVLAGIILLTSIILIIWMPYTESLAERTRQLMQSHEEVSPRLSSKFITNHFPAASTLGILVFMLIPSICIGIFVFLNLSLSDHLLNQYSMIFQSVETEWMFFYVASLFFLSCILAGYISDKIGSRKLIMFGLMLSITGIALIFPRDDFYTHLSKVRVLIYIALMCIALGTSLCVCPSLSEIIKGLKNLKTRKSGNSGGLIVFSFSLGELVGFIVSNSLSFKAACIVYIVLFSVGMTLFVTEAVVRYFLTGHKSENVANYHDMLIKTREIPLEELQQFASTLVEKKNEMENEWDSVKSKSLFELEELDVEMDDVAKKNMIEKRQEAKKELLFTEYWYWLDLRVFQKKYVDSFIDIQKKDPNFPVSSDETDALFSHIQSIENLSRYFFEDLLKSDIDVIGTFEKYTSFLSIYSEFVECHQKFIELLGKKQKNRKFSHFLKVVEKSEIDPMIFLSNIPSRVFSKKAKEGFMSSFQNQNIKSYLIKPIQRIPRYLLMLREIRKNTPKLKENFEELRRLEDIIKAVDKVCRKIDSSDESRKEMLEILELQGQIAGNFDSLVLPHRKLIRHGPAQRITGGLFRNHKEVYLYLFNDILLWVTNKKVFKGVIDLTGAVIIPVKKSTENLEHAFHLIPNSHSNKLYDVPLTLSFYDEDLKETWENDIKLVSLCLKKTVKGLVLAKRQEKEGDILRQEGLVPSRLESPTASDFREGDIVESMTEIEF